MIDIRPEDCTDGMASMRPDSVDLVVTDPPYTTPTVTAFGRTPQKNYGDLSIQRHFFESIRDEWERLLTPDGNAFVFCDEEYYPVLFEVFYEWQFTKLLVWDKGRIGMGTPFRRSFELVFFASPHNAIETYDDETRPDILDFSTVGRDDKIHGAQKPVDLIRHLISGFCPEDGTVLDPFLGSGSTAVAAKHLERDCIGFEINEDYAETAQKRLDDVEAQQRLPLQSD